MSASVQQRPAEPETTHFDRPVLNTRVSEIKNKEIPATSGFDTPSSSDPRDPIEVEDLKRALAAKMQKMIERILALPSGSKVVLWNSGCIQLAGKTLPMRADDAVIMYSTLKDDERFINAGLVYLDCDRSEWKATFLCDET